MGLEDIDEDAVYEHRMRLFRELGLTDEQALPIAMSTMRPQPHFYDAKRLLEAGCAPDTLAELLH